MRNMKSLHNSDSIADRLQFTNGRIEDSCKKASRLAGHVNLIVVTKGHPASQISVVIQAGAKHIGENYPEDTTKKWAELDPEQVKSVSWHMIGHLQSRKVPLIMRGFDYFHALDSVRLARKISNRSVLEARSPLPVLIQYNVSGEEDKFGFPAWDEKNWPGLLSDFNELSDLNGIRIMGLMTMPPYTETPGKNRVYFDRLRRLREYLASQFPTLDLHELSMGTSQDYEDAVLEGATLLRVGTEIMGLRSDSDT